MTENTRILIVDDEPAVLEVCRRTLAAPDCRIETAATGDEALPLIQTGDYDLVLTDLLMPGTVDGRGLFDEVKRRAPSTGVIIMTGCPSLDTAIPLLKNGALDYLLKPFDRDLLRTAVAHGLSKRRLSQEQDLEEMKEAFLTRVSHELRTPLAPLFLVLDQIQKAAPGAKIGVLCELIGERLRRLQEVIENVLLFSDLKRSGYECSRKETNARELLEKVIVRY